MAQLEPASVLLLLTIVKHGFGESVHVILGARVTFPGTANCSTGELAQLHRIREQSTRLVAARQRGVCNPAEDYRDRVDHSFCFAFSYSVYTDTGLYEFMCGSRRTMIQLDVVVGSEASAREGDQLKLQCYYNTAGKHVDSIRWEKDGRVVLNHSLSTGETSYESGGEREMLLSDDGLKHGDWSLIIQQAQLEDEGDFFCSVLKNGLRAEWGSPAAVRVKVTKRESDETTIIPPLTTTLCATGEEAKSPWIPVGICLAVGLFVGCLLGWCMKSRCSCGSAPI